MSFLPALSNLQVTSADIGHANSSLSIHIFFGVMKNNMEPVEL